MKPQWIQGFSHALKKVFPYFFPYLPFSLLRTLNPVDVRLHSGGALVLHPFGNMSVNIQREGGGSVAQVGLNGLDIIPVLERQDRKRMPLWHNKDESKNPCDATG
nr:hypothetical protein [uncultured Oscillibacter sp.]